MALGATTYKTPNPIFSINSDLTDKEGCGVYLDGANTLTVATLSTDVPYGIVVVGCNHDGSKIVTSSALELVDQLGCVVQVQISGETSVSAGEFLYIDMAVQDGTFTQVYPPNLSVGEWVWGMALTDADAGQQCLMRFQPYLQQYVAP